MPVTPLLGPAPIRAGESILDPKPDRSFASVPIYDHEREWIPKITTGRNLVLCFDGTGGSFNEDVSQPSHPGSRPRLDAAFLELQRRAILGDAEEGRSRKTARLLSGDFPQSTCKVYHPSPGFRQAGIGTYSVSAVKIPFIATVSRILDYMFASSLPDHVKGLSFTLQVPRSTISRRLTNRSRRIPVFDAKLSVNSVLNPFSLWETYSIRPDRAGDKICIFGFSRGAYTARVLAGILQRVGLLSRSNLEQLPFAYAMYKKADKDGDSLCKGFKRTFSIDVKINFLGVWYVVQYINQLFVPYLRAGTP